MRTPCWPMATPPGAGAASRRPRCRDRVGERWRVCVTQRRRRSRVRKPHAAGLPTENPIAVWCSCRQQTSLVIRRRPAFSGHGARRVKPPGDESFDADAALSPAALGPIRRAGLGGARRGEEPERQAGGCGWASPSSVWRAVRCRPTARARRAARGWVGVVRVDHRALGGNCARASAHFERGWSNSSDTAPHASRSQDAQLLSARLPAGGLVLLQLLVLLGLAARKSGSSPRGPARRLRAGACSAARPSPGRLSRPAGRVPRARLEAAEISICALSPPGCVKNASGSGIWA